jgi:hypothetical protein
MRPRGSLGEVAVVLRQQALQQPGPVRELAARAQVGYDCARYTATRLVQAGELAVLNPGQRPAVLGPPDAAAQAANDAFVLLSRSFWEGGVT